MSLPRSVEVVFVSALLLLAAGTFAPLWTDPATHNAVEGQLSLQGVWAAIYVATAIMLGAHRSALLRIVRKQKLLLALLVFVFASVLWSENPSVSLRKAIALLGTTMIGVLFSIRFSVRDQVRFVAAAMVIAAIASALVAALFPHSFPATEYAAGAWNGVFSHKNLLGRAMALGTVACIALARRTARSLSFSAAGALSCFFVLLRAHSQTALIVLALVLLTAAICVALRDDWRLSLGACSLLFIGAASLCWMAVAQFESLAHLLHRDPSLTGRTRIWLFASLSIGERPWLGYGYGAFWWVSRQSKQALALIRYATPHAHNGFLDLMLQLGGSGTLIFAVGWFVSAVFAFRRVRKHAELDAMWPLMFLAFLLFYSISENSLLIANSILWILYVSTVCNLTRFDPEEQHSFSLLMREEPAL